MNMAEKTARIDEICRQAKILPVITIPSEEAILPLADALAAGGLTTLEVTLRSEWGLGAIRLLREQRPQLCVGAGTVIDRRTLDLAEAAGAQFIVSPGCTPELLEAARNSALPLLPGVATASEIMLGLSLGYERFKLFPAEVVGGVAALKAFAGPFPQVRFCPTGGVTPENMGSYRALGNVVCVGGSWMLKPQWLEQGDWDSVERSCAEAIAALA